MSREGKFKLRHYLSKTLLQPRILAWSQGDSAREIFINGVEEITSNRKTEPMMSANSGRSTDGRPAKSG
jgi:hypothetical protein